MRTIKKTMWEQKEELLERRLQQLAGAGDWTGIVQALDQYDQNNDRRHGDHRDYFNPSLLERSPEGEEGYQIPQQLRLFQEDDWLDIIFSQDSADLPELVTEYPTSVAMRNLTPQQREILRQNIVFGIPAKDLAEEMGCTTRNVTKQRQKALEKIRLLVTGHQELEVSE